MSSEVEKGKEDSEEEEEKEVEQIKEEPKRSLDKRIKDQWQLILKILELVLCALCIGFFFEPANRSVNLSKHHLEQVGVIFTAFTGYMLINAVLIFSRCIGDKIPFRISSIFSICASVLFLVSGILLIVDRRNKFQGMYYEPHMYLTSMLTASTVFSFINCVVFAADGVYTFILQKHF